MLLTHRSNYLEMRNVKYKYLERIIIKLNSFLYIIIIYIIIII
jgi:hypothetical protein